MSNDLEGILVKWKETIEACRGRRIDSLDEEDREIMLGIFHDIEEVLGPVGAAKALHLLAPYFFPIWDRRIAYRYGLGLGPRGKNSEKHYSFMMISKDQYESLEGKIEPKEDILKKVGRVQLLSIYEGVDIDIDIGAS